MTEESLKPYVIGLDLGGTNSVFGIVDSRGDIKATTAIKTQGYGNNVQAYVDAAVDALQIIIEQAGVPVVVDAGIAPPGVGVGARQTALRASTGRGHEQVLVGPRRCGRVNGDMEAGMVGWRLEASSLVPNALCGAAARWRCRPTETNG